MCQTVVWQNVARQVILCCPREFPRRWIVSTKNPQFTPEASALNSQSRLETHGNQMHFSAQWEQGNGPTSHYVDLPLVQQSPKPKVLTQCWFAAITAKVQLMLQEANANLFKSFFSSVFLLWCQLLQSTFMCFHHIVAFITLMLQSGLTDRQQCK